MIKTVLAMVLIWFFYVFVTVLENGFRWNGRGYRDSYLRHSQRKESPRSEAETEPRPRG